MDQGIGVHAFDGHGGRQGHVALPPKVGGGEGEHGA